MSPRRRVEETMDDSEKDVEQPNSEEEKIMLWA
jgi:hypothetical protein